MDGTGKKDHLLPPWLWVISSFLFILSLIVDYASGTLCSNNVNYEMPSPDGKLKAVTFMRHCGSTTGYASQLSVLDRSDAIREHDSGNVFVAGAKQPARLEVRWKDPSTLIVTRDPAIQISKEDNWVAVWKFPIPRFVSVEYRNPEFLGE